MRSLSIAVASAVVSTPAAWSWPRIRAARLLLRSERVGFSDAPGPLRPLTPARGRQGALLLELLGKLEQSPATAGAAEQPVETAGPAEGTAPHLFDYAFTAISVAGVVVTGGAFSNFKKLFVTVVLWSYWRNEYEVHGNKLYKVAAIVDNNNFTIVDWDAGAVVAGDVKRIVRVDRALSPSMIS